MSGADIFVGSLLTVAVLYALAWAGHVFFEAVIW